MRAYRVNHVLVGEWGDFRQHVFDTRDLYNTYMSSTVVIRPNVSSWDNMIFNPKYAISGLNPRNIDIYPKI